MRSWGRVIYESNYQAARHDASVLRKKGFRAKAMWNLKLERWELCVSPDTDADAARAIVVLA